MPNGVQRFLKNQIELRITDGTEPRREGWRSLFDCAPAERDLARYLGGQIPYFYREPEKIAKDFIARHDALDAVFDLATKAPTSKKFQQSHCGEILAALFMEEVLGFKILYSKLTLLTAENTNAHKMDGFFVNLSTKPFTFAAVEAKTSILPTEKTQCGGHRHGILKQMIGSLEGYTKADQRFDFTLIRDNLSSGRFTETEVRDIRNDLMPPGPERLIQVGIATINESTVCPKDDHYILTEPCGLDFTFKSLVVADLAGLAHEAYGHVSKLKK